MRSTLFVSAAASVPGCCFPCKTPATRRRRENYPAASGPSGLRPAPKPPGIRARWLAIAPSGEPRWGRPEPFVYQKSVITFSTQSSHFRESADLNGIVSHTIDKKDREQAKLSAGHCPDTLVFEFWHVPSHLRDYFSNQGLL